MRIAAGGDFNPGTGSREVAASRGPRYAWASVGPFLKAADIATVNLEGVVSSRGSPVPDKEFHFRGPRSMLAGAVDAAGLDVVTVANNHSLDFGPTAFLDTLVALRALGVRSVGGGANLAKARQARDPRGGRAEDRVPRLLGRRPVRLRRDVVVAGDGRRGLAPFAPTSGSCAVAPTSSSAGSTGARSS